MQLVVADSLPNCVVPIFLVTGKDEFRHWGSALFFRYEKAFCLVTASHVVAGLNGNDNLLMPGWGNVLTETPDKWIKTMPAVPGVLKSDTDDVAVATLSEEMVAGLFKHDYGCLDERTIDPLPLCTGDDVVFHGFPGEEQTCIHARDFSLVHTRPHAFHTKIARRSEALGCGFADDLYLVAEYRYSKDFPFPQQKSQVPLPPGMSGGAVYRFQDGKPVGFVGIAHRWIDPGLLVATRAHGLFQILDAAIAQDPYGFRHEGPAEV